MGHEQYSHGSCVGDSKASDFFCFFRFSSLVPLFLSTEEWGDLLMGWHWAAVKFEGFNWYYFISFIYFYKFFFSHLIKL